MTTAKILLEANAQVNVADKVGCTPLHWAAQQKSPELLKLLLDKGADPAAKDHRGLTAHDVTQQVQLDLPLDVKERLLAR